MREGADLDAAAFDAGYESLSGFREAFGRYFGRPPGLWPRRRVRVAAWLRTPLGPMVAAATSTGVCLLEFTDRRMLETQLRVLNRRLRLPLVPGENDNLRALRAELDEYFAGRRRAFEVPLHVSGTPFQESVWGELRRIPYGETRSYADVARAVGSPDAVLKFTREDYKTVCIVEDDGIGMKKTEEMKSFDHEKESRGISIVNERLKIINKLLKGSYQVTISNLYADRTETGTRVKIDLPVITD